MAHTKSFLFVLGSHSLAKKGEEKIMSVCDGVTQRLNYKNCRKIEHCNVVVWVNKLTDAIAQCTCVPSCKLYLMLCLVNGF